MSSLEGGGAPAKRAEEKIAPSSPPANPIPSEILQGVPQQVRAKIEGFMATAMSMGPPPNPIAAKVTSEHISEFLKIHSRSLELDNENSQNSRKYATLVVLSTLFVTATVIITLALAGQTALLIELVKAGVFITGGFGGGFGFSEWRRRKGD